MRIGDYDKITGKLARRFSFSPSCARTSFLSPCLVGVQNFVPHPTEDGYEPFSQLIEKANLWLKDQTDIRLTNMQSLLVQKDIGEFVLELESSHCTHRPRTHREQFCTSEKESMWSNDKTFEKSEKNLKCK